MLAGCQSEPAAPGEGLEYGAEYSSNETGGPHLTFNEDGTYSGSDGCNGINGSFTSTGTTLTLDPGVSTLRGCLGVDDWLRSARSIAVIDASTLQVEGADGDTIGTLTRTQ